MAEETTRPPLTAHHIGRYQRQMVLPEVGFDGQRQLLGSRVLVVGAGALGSAAATYLVAAGVGTVGLVDGDRVELSNLHRQILHDESQIGRLKTESGAERLKAVNPDVRIMEHPEFLSSENVMELFDQYDLIVNGSDNFPTRYLVNDAAVLTRKPLVDAAILRFEGQLSVFRPGHGCYRCLFPSPPPPGTVPDCAEAGVFGAVAGVLGSMQAVEALKILLQLRQPEASTLLLYDALNSSWQRMPFSRDPECAVCGDFPSVTAPIDYADFCGFASTTAVSTAGVSVAWDVSTVGVSPAWDVSAAGVSSSSSVSPAADVSPARDVSAKARKAAEAAQGAGAFSVNVEEALQLMQDPRLTIVDVREPEEFATGHMANAVNCPLQDLDGLSSEELLQAPVLVVCAAGVRSAHAAEYLRALGYQAWTLTGGMQAWRASGSQIIT
ncbi:molybdopterin-synthase adenylyltransferase MoeB [Alicyclobacillus ferrooxydans]|uniref:Rhodanese domain-containing protein n=1 Tax=Alicyclobacillus ferrooxydans TaxID=471514 RepID=A0A0P9GQ47_9BACL|nr:molybdopterin-synthase adenylyltransferase MoeB [Alicyclobacillus ferrooxydans]KPV42883.1 hypothetical protein AN477_15220 [Alicyclobacillus ferrooxydans]